MSELALEATEKERKGLKNMERWGNNRSKKKSVTEAAEKHRKEGATPSPHAREGQEKQRPAFEY